MIDSQTMAVENFAKENAILPTSDMPDTPAAWLAAKFPALEKLCGRAADEVTPDEDEGRPSVKDLSEDFLASTLGEHGAPDAPTVFVGTEDRFYQYQPREGIYMEIREPALTVQLSALLLECSRACAGTFDTRNLEFKFRDSANLKGGNDSRQRSAGCRTGVFSERLDGIGAL
jgi:hypothetical protein